MTTGRSQVSPLDWKTRIVDPETGNPTLQFIRLWQSLFGNEDGTNALASSASSIAVAAVPQSRKINTTAPIAGGGDLSTDRTLTHNGSGVTPGVYGDATHVPAITVDSMGHVTAVTNTSITGGSGSNQILYPNATWSGADAGLFATLSNSFIALENFTVDRLYATWSNDTIGNVYNMFIAAVNSSGVVSSVLATATSFTTTATGIQTHAFNLSTSATITAGTIYIIALVRTNGTTTTANKALVSASDGYTTMPRDVGSMIVNLGSSVKRFWYTSNTATPSAGLTPSSSSTVSQYCFGMRAQF